MARTPSMNRIRDLREAAGLDQAELAARVGTSPQQVGRHERGERRLTIQWVQRYAQALDVTASEIMGAPELTSTRSEVEPASVDGMPGLSSLSNVLAQRSLRLYRVVQSMVPDSGVHTGDIITIDESDASRQMATSGDVVLASLGGGDILILRVFVAPHMLVTNMPGTRNTVLRLDDRSADIRLVGRAIMPEQRDAGGREQR